MRSIFFCKILLLNILICSQYYATEEDLQEPSLIFEEDIASKNWEALKTLLRNKKIEETSQPLDELHYKHYSIMQSIKDGKGTFADENFSLFPPTLKTFFNNVVGRIFIIDANGQFDFGSGMLVHKNGKNYVLTCKHNFKAPQNCSFYFVPKFMLNPKTGFPDGIKNKNHLKYVLYTLSQFDNSAVMKLNHKKMLRFDQLPVDEVSLAGGDTFEDSVVLCEYTKEIDAGTQYLLKNNNNIDFTTTSLRLNKFPYYAVGFPVIPKLFVINKTEWAYDEDLSGLAPLIVTQALGTRHIQV